MNSFLNDLKLALGTFLGNPLRSLLTLLGIVIGVATFLTLMALLEGLRHKVHNDLSQLGAHTFQVTRWPSNLGRVDWQRYARRENLSREDLRAISESCPSVGRVSASDTEDGQQLATGASGARPRARVIGATPEYPDTSGLTVASGRFFGQTEEVDGRPVVVLGPEVAEALFPGTEPIGHHVRIQRRTFTVIGVLKRRGSLLSMASMDDQAIIPLRSYQQLYGKGRSLDLNIQARSPELLQVAQDEVSSLLRHRRDVPPLESNDFDLRTSESVSEVFNRLSQLIAVAGSGVSLLALVVGGIGILNIMLVSVAERTREIGLRRALGARRRHILGQFATEAVVLALLGGALGVTLGFGLAALGRWLLGLPAMVPAWSVVLSLVMSSGVGLVAGIYPATRAARLDPVQAITGWGG